jgi:hypothetical protein
MATIAIAAIIAAAIHAGLDVERAPPSFVTSFAKGFFASSIGRI